MHDLSTKGFGGWLFFIAMCVCPWAMLMKDGSLGDVDEEKYVTSLSTEW